MSNQTLPTTSSRLSSVKSAFAAAAPYLRDFREALDLGRLVICAQCVSFDFAADPNAPGHCRHFSVESYPFVPFACDRFGRRQRKAAS